MAVTPNTKLFTERELILLRDTMELSELKRQTKECKETYGIVDYRHIFMIMGYTYAFNHKWYLN